ncbi:MAG: DUF4271 domain-containing protein [Bacteroidetes bacterium]|nr:DUF4271 domain-containing protein [Bacteroidota bacterium]
MKQILLILVSIFTFGIAFGQKDSLAVDTAKPTVVMKDTAKTSVDQRDSVRKDSIVPVVIKKAVVQEPDTLTYEKYYTSAWLPFHQPPIFEIEPERKSNGKDLIFYLLTGLVTALACIRLIFPKYLKNLFMLFMQTSIRQKQTREQLLQNNLASVFLNILFVASAGIYITLFIQYMHWVDISFYRMLLYCMSILFIIYIGKYLFLAFSGWVFNVPEATNAYTFIVFLVNKVLGIVLIPFILMITFSPVPIKQIAITISAGVAIVLFMYRYLISFGVIRANLKVSAFHFFLYLCAVELLPLLLIYKLLVNFVSGGI